MIEIIRNVELCMCDKDNWKLFSKTMKAFVCLYVYLSGKGMWKTKIYAKVSVILYTKRPIIEIFIKNSSVNDSHQLSSSWKLNGNEKLTSIYPISCVIQCDKIQFKLSFRSFEFFFVISAQKSKKSAFLECLKRKIEEKKKEKKEKNWRLRKKLFSWRFIKLCAIGGTVRKKEAAVPAKFVQSFKENKKNQVLRVTGRNDWGFMQLTTTTCKLLSIHNWLILALIASRYSRLRQF